MRCDFGIVGMHQTYQHGYRKSVVAGGLLKGRVTNFFASFQDHSRRIWYTGIARLVCSMSHMSYQHAVKQANGLPTTMHVDPSLPTNQQVASGDDALGVGHLVVQMSSRSGSRVTIHFSSQYPNGMHLKSHWGFFLH